MFAEVNALGNAFDTIPDVNTQVSAVNREGIIFLIITELNDSSFFWKDKDVNRKISEPQKRDNAFSQALLAESGKLSEYAKFNIPIIKKAQELNANIFSFELR